MPSKNKGAALPTAKQNKNAAVPPANAQKKPVKKQGQAKQIAHLWDAVGTAAANTKKAGGDEKTPTEQPMTLEELIETERNALNSDQCTRVTIETFNAWKREKLKQRRKRELAEQKQKLAAVKQGKRKGLSGRDLLQLNPEDDEEVTPIQYEKEVGDGEVQGPPVKPFEIDEKTFLDGLSISDSDGAGEKDPSEAGSGGRDEDKRQ